MATVESIDRAAYPQEKKGNCRVQEASRRERCRSLIGKGCWPELKPEVDAARKRGTCKHCKIIQ